MALLINFPLNYNDQIDVIEIFDGLMRQWDAESSTETKPRVPVGRIPELPDPGFWRGSSAQTGSFG